MERDSLFWQKVVAELYLAEADSEDLEVYSRAHEDKYFKARHWHSHCNSLNFANFFNIMWLSLAAKAV